MKNWDWEDYLYFEKIIRRRKKKKAYLKPYDELHILSQTFGSIHTVENSKVKYFNEKDNYYKNKIRPGVVIEPPKEPLYETEWVPMSSKIMGRNPEKVVFLNSLWEPVEVDSVILLEFRCWFKFKSLSKKRGEISEKKKEELRTKLDKLNLNMETQ